MARARATEPKVVKPEALKTDVVEVVKPESMPSEITEKQKAENTSGISGHNKFAKFKK